jgi:peptidoglycan/LPS O-acetylase OafA/YrhL
MLERRYFLDAIKCISIILIILGHLGDYLEFPFLSRLNTEFYYVGLSGFIFSSGYLVSLNNPVLRTKKNIFSFYKKRVVRIFPLYLLSLFCFYLCFQLNHFVWTFNYNISGWIIHILGLQILLSPLYVIPMFTLWFVGLILLLYFLYPVFCYSESKRDLLLVSFAIFCLALIIHYSLNLIHMQFFIYYWIFILGIFLAKSNYNFNGIEFFIKRHTILLKFILAVSIASFCIYLFHRPLFSIFVTLLNSLNLDVYVHDLLLYLCVIPFIFIISYYIQIYYDKFVNKIL